jgi:diacylglycerol kinase (ATP)
MLCLRTSRNFRIQLAVAALALILGAFLALERWEWCAIIFCIVMVLAAEAFNSALERTVDLTCHGYDERAGAAKDLAAGAVLLLSAGAVLIGLAIFIAAAVRLLP